ncbi:nucleotidyltransferase family protein [Halopseudomonas nanhaiensis]|uniref:nucleotidyltransferase family protein n=1 Tax=Halopseudomonas nanhaiensis TaxID=2830842 RepID=UPI003C2DC4A0|nr:nucleotidyltransferase family protein [Halopseudomonas nanhaiensis]
MACVRSLRRRCSVPDSSEGVCALVLSAGQGSRYRAEAGEDKLLAPCFDDIASPPVLAATLSALRGVAERTIVVVRADNRPLRDWLDTYAPALKAEVFAVHSNGLGDSLAQAVERYPARRGWLVALGDMPYVKESTLSKVAGAIDETSLVVPTFGGQAGHPRGIGTVHWAALLELHGDTGAQALFANAEQVVELAVDDPGIVQDVDTPDDRRSMPASNGAG